MYDDLEKLELLVKKARQAGESWNLRSAENSLREAQRFVNVLPKATGWHYTQITKNALLEIDSGLKKIALFWIEDRRDPHVVLEVLGRRCWLNEMLLNTAFPFYCWGVRGFFARHGWI